MKEGSISLEMPYQSKILHNISAISRTVQGNIVTSANDENPQSILNVDIRKQIILKKVYYEYKDTITAIYTDLVKSKNVEIIVPVHKYSQEEFLIPLASWKGKEVFVVTFENNGDDKKVLVKEADKKVIKLNFIEE